MKTRALQTCCFIHLDASADELLAVREAAGDTGLPFHISQFFSLQQVLDYVGRKGSFKDYRAHPVPAFILLDHDLGNIPGPNVVRQIRRLPHGQALPIIVYKDTINQLDATLWYGAGANHLLTRSPSLSRTKILLELLYHCATATPPEFAELSKSQERCCSVAQQWRRGVGLATNQVNQFANW